MERAQLGIDFGTCYSSAALYIHGKTQLIKDADGFDASHAVPSSAYITDAGEIVIGKIADNQRRLHPERYRREFKRDLGSGIPYLMGDVRIKSEELISRVIAKLKSGAEAETGDSIDSVVLTVPATYQQHKRLLMEKAAADAGFKEVKLIEEPVAAAIYYAGKSHAGSASEGETVLVYDLGGGTFDATLVKKNGAGYSFVGLPSGLEHCGGTDFDRAIFTDFAEKCSSQILELLDPARRDVNALRARLIIADFCRDFKHSLSSVDVYEDLIPLGLADAYRLSRADFNALIDPFLGQTITCCREMIKDAKLELTDISRVLLVGGSCRIPYVKEKLERELGRPVVSVDDPELAVCQGAARIAAGRPKATASRVENGRESHTPAVCEKATAAVEVRAFVESPVLQGHRNDVEAVCFSPDGRLLASGSLDNSVKLWDLGSGTALGTLGDQPGCVDSVCFSPDGRQLAVGGRDSAVRLWNMEAEGRSRVIVSCSHVRSMCFSPDGTMLASGIRRYVMLCDVANGRRLRTLPGHSAEVCSVCFSPDGNSVASGSGDGRVRVWDVATGRRQRSFNHIWSVHSVCFAHSGLVLVSAGEDCMIRFWSLSTGKELRTLRGHSSCVTSLCFSPDDSILASGGHDGVVRLWDPADGKRLRVLRAYSAITCVCFSPDGRTLVAGGVDGRIRVWKAGT